MLRYFDASILIDLTDPNSALFATISSAIQALPAEERCASELVRLECMVQPTRNGDSSRLAFLESFFKTLVNLPIDRAVYDLAISLRAKHQALKTPDAIHLAIALRHGCAEFWTNDRDLAKRPVALAFRTF